MIRKKLEEGNHLQSVAKDCVMLHPILRRELTVHIRNLWLNVASICVTRITITGRHRQLPDLVKLSSSATRPVEHYVTLIFTAVTRISSRQGPVIDLRIFRNDVRV